MIHKDFVRTLDTSSDSYRTVKEEFLAFAQDLGLGPEHLPAWNRLEAWLKSLVVERHWNRKLIFEMVEDVLNTSSALLPPVASEALTDYEGALCGDCAIEFVPRFPGEPEDLTEFRRYLYSGVWLQ